MRILARVLIVILVIAALAASVIAGAVVGFIDNSMDLIAEEYNLDFTSIIYYIDEETNQPVEMDRIHRNENRVWVDIENIPENLTNAFIAIEDERFRDHKGVDLKRTFGAFLQWITGNKNSYGGSTITQQLIKNITGENDVSPTRKIQEIVRAINLEKKMSKDQIIEMYMNTIYFGAGCHGVQTAANYYFSKDVKDLTLEQCASLAGVVKAPTTYNPATNYEKNKERQEVILTKMAKLGYISQQECDEAKGRNLNVKIGEVKKDKEDVKVQSYFVDAIITDVVRDLMEKENLTEGEATNRLYTGGFKIYSTMNPDVQKAIDNVYQNTANFPGSSGNKPQSAMVVMDPYTGQIKGMAGGIGKKTVSRGFNMATQAKRQPGSAIKPLAVYAPAIEYNIITPATIINDAKIKIGDWEPKNSGGGYKGRLTARRHLELSQNIPAVKVMQELTVDKSFDFMTKNLGFTTMVAGETRNGKLVTDKSLSMSLGGLTDGVTVKEMTAGYATFVNGGQYNKPVTYTKVIDANGKIVLENKVENKRAMSEQTAFIMQNMLTGVIKNGTGTSASLGDIYAGGKTGTTNSNKDRWFMGFTPNYVAGVWMGYEIPKAMSGSNVCPKIWKSVMQPIHDGKTIKTIPEPDGLVKRTICQISGRVASKSCSTTRVDYFKEGTQPMKYCSSHSSYGSSLGDDDDDKKTSSSKKSSKPSSSSSSTPEPGEELNENNQNNVSPGTNIPNEEETPDDNSTEGDGNTGDTWYGEE
ncbi:PBP1A family penicillin-binding protein [Congzhengia sp.]|uniref:transglycosylase domain-containing protein n=1 Tax=Congzhengia sp. TaxID=2944168 RepID=UPI0030787790